MFVDTPEQKISSATEWQNMQCTYNQDAVILQMQKHIKTKQSHFFKFV